MPCSTHAVADILDCSHCFANQLIQLTANVQTGTADFPEGSYATKPLVSRLEKVRKKVKKGEDSPEDLFRSLIHALNVLGVSQGKKPIDLFNDFGGNVVGPVQDNERLAYRARLQQLGTWVGLAEFHVLASAFNARFAIMMAQGNGEWRRLDVGPGGGTDLGAGGPRLRALAFSGNHYEVGEFTAGLHGAYARNTTTVTNAHGDCGLESFLLLYLQSGAGLPGGDRAPERDILRTFRRAREAHVGANGGGPNAVAMDRQHQDYQDAIRGVRERIDYWMTDEELEHAIIAEGRPDAESSEPKASVKGAIDTPALTLSSARQALPWGPAFALQAKRGGSTGCLPVAFTPIGSDNAYSVTPNFAPAGNIGADVLAFLRTKSRNLQGAVGAQGLYAKAVARKDLQFIYDELRAHVNARESVPTHFGAALLCITTDKGTWNFVLAGLNIDCGNGHGANASICYPGGGNALHTEKYILGLSYLILSGFGAVKTPINPQGEPTLPLLCGGSLAHFATTSNLGAAKAQVASVRIIFLNALVMCGTCAGYWSDFRRALTDAGINEVAGEVYYYTDKAKSI